MAQKRPKDWLSNLLYFLFSSKIFSWQYFGTKRRPVLQFERVRECWPAEKWLQKQEKSKCLDIDSFQPHQNVFNYFDHHRKVTVLTDFFYVESLFPTCLVWALWLFEWKQLIFLGNIKTGFSSERRHLRVQPTSKDSLLYSGSDYAITIL